MENVIVLDQSEFKVLGEELNSFLNESNASEEDKSKFKEEFQKAHSFFVSCTEELKVRSKNGKDYVKDLAIAFWNKVKDLATKVFGYCKDLFNKVKEWVMSLFN